MPPSRIYLTTCRRGVLCARNAAVAPSSVHGPVFRAPPPCCRRGPPPPRRPLRGSLPPRLPLCATPCTTPALSAASRAEPLHRRICAPRRPICVLLPSSVRGPAVLPAVVRAQAASPCHLRPGAPPSLRPHRAVFSARRLQSDLLVCCAVLPSAELLRPAVLRCQRAAQGVPVRSAAPYCRLLLRRTQHCSSAAPTRDFGTLHPVCFRSVNLHCFLTLQYVGQRYRCQYYA